MTKRRPWQEELEIVDRTMRAISGIADPEELVEAYWNGIGELVPIIEYVALSRRNVEPPYYLVTRSSRFTEHFNPWTQRDRLPKLNGGLLGELAYANKPVIIDDVPSRLMKDDPGRFYLEGAQRLIALPQYDSGEGINVTAMLFPAEFENDPTMIPILHWQAGLFGRGTQNLVLRNQLAVVNGALDRELKIVGEIQRSLLPETLPIVSGFDFAAYYETSSQAGGDYYDFFPLPDGKLGLLIADVSGHGSPAAVLMAITHALAHAQPGTQLAPGKLLCHLNDHLCRTYTRNGTFITAFYAVLDPQRKCLTFSRAGQNPPRLLRSGRILSLEDGGAIPLGLSTDQDFTEATLQLEKNDLLVLYTDGIVEASPQTRPDQSRDFFELERLDSLLIECGEASSAEQCLRRIRDGLAAFTKNAAPTDDRTLIAMRCSWD